MRIGLDFDNTIVNYDHVFHLVAREGGLIPKNLARSKLQVRNFLCSAGKEDVWTEMQGFVYGKRMSDAAPSSGVIEFMRWANERGHELRIISHKTQYPYIGKKYDLHKSAREWVKQILQADKKPLVEAEHVFFDVTKEAKLRRIKEQGCELFIDDLPEILLAPEFPGNARAILFDPERHYCGLTKLTSVGSWNEIRAHMELLCATAR